MLFVGWTRSGFLRKPNFKRADTKKWQGGMEKLGALHRRFMLLDGSALRYYEPRDIRGRALLQVTAVDGPRLLSSCLPSCYQHACRPACRPACRSASTLAVSFHLDSHLNW